MVFTDLANHQPALLDKVDAPVQLKALVAVDSQLNLPLSDAVGKPSSRLTFSTSTFQA